MSVAGDLQRLASLIRQLQGVARVALPFAAGWANYGSSFEDATYSRFGLLVVLQGLVEKPGGTPGAGDLIATLPDGFRPTETLVFTVETFANTIGTNQKGRVDVDADGSVRWRAGATSGAAADNYTSLSGLSFVVPA